MIMLIIATATVTTAILPALHCGNVCRSLQFGMSRVFVRFAVTLGVAGLVVAATAAEPLQPCYMQYQHPTLVNKSIDFENPSVFELLASNYSRQRSPFFELLHRERECVALSYWINNEPDSVEFRGSLHFSCGIQELLRIDLLHAPNGQAPGGYCLTMRHADRQLEQLECAGLGLSRAVPVTLQAHVGSMVILAQETAHSLDYLLFQRVIRHQDMLNTLKYFEARYQVPPGTLERRIFYSSSHWLRCDCERLLRGMAPLYQCLGINRNRHARGEFSIPSLSKDMLVMVVIGIGGGVTFFLLLKIRLISPFPKSSMMLTMRLGHVKNPFLLPNRGESCSCSFAEAGGGNDDPNAPSVQTLYDDRFRLLCFPSSSSGRRCLQSLIRILPFTPNQRNPGAVEPE
uniref:Uncharacterized protein n=1 Tax=Anopheles atroparvus TaxID=41427 RepID=A0A182JH58_ANOAO